MSNDVEIGSIKWRTIAKDNYICTVLVTLLLAQNGTKIVLLVNTDRKEGVFPIIQQIQSKSEETVKLVFWTYPQKYILHLDNFGMDMTSVYLERI